MKDEYVRAMFTNYITKLIKHSAIDFFRKANRNKDQISIYEINEENYCVYNQDTDGSFFDDFSENFDIENAFKEEKIAKAVKKLTKIQKQVIYYLVIERLPADTVAKMLNTNVYKIYNIKKYAIKKILKNYKEE